MTDRDDDPLMPDFEPVSESDQERAERAEALLSLSSKPPASLDARIAARRAAGDRVLLPVPDAPGIAPTSSRPRPPLLWPILLAAAAITGFIVIRALGDRSTRPDDTVSPPVVAGVDSPPPVIGATPLPDSLRPADSARVRPGAGEPLAPRRNELGLGFDRTRVAAALYGTRLREFRSTAVDSIAAAAVASAAATIAISYPEGNAGLESLARQVEHDLTRRGIAATRIRVSAAQPEGPAMPAVTVLVERATPR